jgi:hypothetical protein
MMFPAKQAQGQKEARSTRVRLFLFFLTLPRSARFLLGLQQFVDSSAFMKWVKLRRPVSAFWPLLLVLTCALWGMTAPLSLLPDRQGADLRTHDADTHYFFYAWEETPSFQDTLKWWHGPWGQKFRPFYRPIPSLLFWTQYKIFGINGALPFHVLVLLWHLIALLFIWRFLVDLLGLRDGTLATCLWGASVGHHLEWMAPRYALYNWKDNVESWHALAFTACLWAFLRFLKTEKQRWQVAALLLFLIALCVKEMAYIAPFVMLLLCWHQQKLQGKWRAVLPFFAVAGIMFFFRLWALGSMGFRMSGNRSWKFRALNENLGGAFTRILNGDCLMLSLIVATVGLWWLRRWRRAPLESRQHEFTKVMLLLATSISLLFYTSYKTDIPWDETASRILVENEWIILSLLVPMLFFWYRFFLNRNRHQIFGALFALAVYAPLTSGANTAHIYYYPAVGWSIWLAYGLLDAVSLIRNWWIAKSDFAMKFKGAT